MPTPNTLKVARPHPVTLGERLPAPGSRGDWRVLCDAPELERHVGQPWFRAWASARLGVEPPDRDADFSPRRVDVGDDLLARHAGVFGATGGGKTRLVLHLLAAHVRAGGSVVMLDPKAETLHHLLHLAREAGMRAEEVILLSPRGGGAGAPGWNPLDGNATETSPSQAAADFVSVLAQTTSSWGPRLQDLLTNALIIVAANGLSPFELARLLQWDDYRAGLLMSTPRGSGDDPAYEEARDYFAQEFARWGRAERASAVAPVLNKFREVLRQPFLRALLCARRNTLRLDSLWQRRGLVLVHLDGAALGDEGARLLGGLLVHRLYRTAMRATGPVAVTLAMDEMGLLRAIRGCRPVRHSGGRALSESPPPGGLPAPGAALRGPPLRPAVQRGSAGLLPAGPCGRAPGGAGAHGGDGRADPRGRRGRGGPRPRGPAGRLGGSFPHHPRRRGRPAEALPGRLGRAAVTVRRRMGADPGGRAARGRFRRAPAFTYAARTAAVRASCPATCAGCLRTSSAWRARPRSAWSSGSRGPVCPSSPG